VGCFFSFANYDAIVPGQEDFYFGPERLRRIAQRLAAVRDNGALHPVQMVASNLVVKTSYWTDPTKISDAQKGLKFTPGLPDNVEAKEIKDHDTVLPFLREIHLQTKPQPTRPEAYLCLASNDYDPDSLDPCPNRIALLPADSKPESIPDKEHSSWTYRIPIFLQAHRNYGLCMTEKDAGHPDKNDKESSRGDKQGRKTEKPPHCARFTVAEPFLLSRQCADTKNCGLYEQPYWFDKAHDVVVFGVVDPDLGKMVGRDNLSWKNADGKLKTQVTALDPVSSLNQAVQLFEQAEHPDQSKLRKVLLAQMNRAEAEELATHLDFDVIISAAADYNHASPVGALTISPNAKFKPQQAPTYHTMVVTPWQAYDVDQRSLVDPVRQLVLHDSENAREIKLSRPYTKWDLGAYRERREEDLTKSFCPLARAILCKQTSATRAAKKTDPICGEEPREGRDIFALSVLKVMQEKTSADIAMMQKRDVYWGPFPASESKGEEIDRILWKGDILRVLTVTGDTLAKVLKESDQFDQAEVGTTKGIDVPRRGLVLWGIEAADNDNYLISGALLDRNRLYTIATTGHLTAGDTGYPELNDPQLADQKLPKPTDLKGAEGERISELVCEKLLSADPERRCVSLQKVSYSTHTCNALFACSEGKVPATKPSLALKLRAWTWRTLDKPFVSEQPPLPEQKVQDRSIWRLSLVQASLSVKWARNNLSEAQRAQLFTGFTEPGIDGANSHSWQSMVQAELVHGGKALDEYVRNQSEYSSQVTEQANALPAVSRDKNRYQFDAGFFYHPFTICHHLLPCFSQHKQYPKAGFVFEPFTRFDSPLAREELVIGSSATGFQKVNLGRAQKYLARSGVRLENVKSHFETGFEAGWERGALVTFVASGHPCPPLPTRSPEGCLMNLTPPVTLDQVRQVRNRRGFYIDWAWTTSLMHGWQNIVQNQAEWFPFGPADDNSSDTRKLFDITEKFSIPIFANLSFQPGVEYFFYRNKFGTHHLDRWTPTASLSWSFDRYSGGKWRKALRHKAGGSNSEQ
jgi:hypothetical protein